MIDVTKQQIVFNREKMFQLRWKKKSIQLRMHDE